MTDKQNPAPMRCISIAEDAKRYFAEKSYKEEISCQMHNIASLLGLLEAAIQFEENKGETLVIPVDEMAQLLRDAMGVKKI